MQTRLIRKENNSAIRERYGDGLVAFKLELDAREVVNICLHLFACHQSNI
jgi:hypothetical protein